MTKKFNIKALCSAYILLPLIVGSVLGFLQLQAPRADESSVHFNRMMYNIERMAIERVVGTENLEYVRDLLIQEIYDMGLTPTIQTVAVTQAEAIDARVRLGLVGSVPPRFFNLPEEFLLHNIFVRLENPNAERTIMFVTHYDSFPGSPGAGDAMAPVTAILEAMRSQADNQYLENNIYFLLTDGEEFGAIGALAFIHEYPELRDSIDMIINVEAQGNRGGLIVFETSPQAHSLLSLYQRAVPRPIGFSIGLAVYDTLNTYTDFSFFREYGWSGINMAIIEGAQHYHMPTDTFENLDRNTAYHYLTVTLGLANYVANNTLSSMDVAENAVFFPFFPNNMIVLTYTWAYILCIFSIVLAIAFLFIEYKNNRLSIYFASYVSMLIAFSTASAIFFHAGSYLFWIPLLTTVIVRFFQKWLIIYYIAKIISRISTLILWIPLVYVSLLFTPVRTTPYILGIFLFIYFASCGIEIYEFRYKKSSMS